MTWPRQSPHSQRLKAGAGLDCLFVALLVFPMFSRVFLLVVDKALGIPPSLLVPSAAYAATSTSIAPTTMAAEASEDGDGGRKLQIQFPAVTMLGVESDSEQSTHGRNSPTPLSSLAKEKEVTINNRIADVAFKPSGRVLLAFGTLAIIILMVSLDGTIISVGLPVRSKLSQHWIRLICGRRSLEHYTDLALKHSGPELPSS